MKDKVVVGDAQVSSIRVWDKAKVLGESVGKGMVNH